MQSSSSLNPERQKLLADFAAAVKGNEVTIVEGFLENKQICLQDEALKGILGYAIKNQLNVDIIRLLLKYGCQIKATEEVYGTNALIWALSTSNTEIIKTIFTHPQVTLDLIQETFKKVPLSKMRDLSYGMLKLPNLKQIFTVEENQPLDNRLALLRSILGILDSNHLDDNKDDYYSNVVKAVTEFKVPQPKPLEFKFFTHLPDDVQTSIKEYTDPMDLVNVNRIFNDEGYKLLYQQIENELKIFYKFYISIAENSSAKKLKPIENHRTAKRAIFEWTFAFDPKQFCQHINPFLRLCVLFLQAYYLCKPKAEFTVFFEKVLENLMPKYGDERSYLLPYLLNALPINLKSYCEYLALVELGFEISHNNRKPNPNYEKISQLIIRNSTQTAKNACLLRVASLPLTVHRYGKGSQFLQELLKAGADPKIKNTKTNLLIEAAKLGCPDLMKMLLPKYKADEINQLNSQGQSVLLSAMTSGNSKQVDAIKLLLEAKADPNQAACYISIDIKLKSHPFIYAAGDKSLFEHFKFLVESKNFDINVRDEDGATALMRIASQEDRVEDLAFLIKNGSGIDAQDNNGRTALDYAFAQNNSNVNFLFEQGANFKLCDNAGLNLLMTLIKMPQYNMEKEQINHAIKLLINKGIDVNARDNNGRTALMHSINDAAKFDILLEFKADLTISSNDGTNVLMLLAKKWFNEVRRSRIPLLLEKGMDINARDKNGWTALMHSTQYLDNFDMLIELGADHTICANDGTNVLMLLAKDCRLENVTDRISLLHKKGMNLNAQDNKGWTALMYAVESINYDALEHLLSLGADPTICAANGDSLITIADQYPMVKSKLKMIIAKYSPNVFISNDVSDEGSVRLRFY